MDTLPIKTIFPILETACDLYQDPYCIHEFTKLMILFLTADLAHENDEFDIVEGMCS